MDNIDTQSVIDDFPRISDGGSFHVSSVSSGKLIKQLVNELESDEIKTILETQFNINLDEAKVATTLRGYSRKKDGKIHTDSKTKILTILLYLNKDWQDSNGNLRLLKLTQLFLILLSYFDP